MRDSAGSRFGAIPLRGGTLLLLRAGLRAAGGILPAVAGTCAPTLPLANGNFPVVRLGGSIGSAPRRSSGTPAFLFFSPRRRGSPSACTLRGRGLGRLFPGRSRGSTSPRGSSGNFSRLRGAVLDIRIFGRLRGPRPRFFARALPSCRPGKARFAGDGRCKRPSPANRGKSFGAIGLLRATLRLAACAPFYRGLALGMGRGGSRLYDACQSPRTRVRSLVLRALRWAPLPGRPSLRIFGVWHIPKILSRAIFALGLRW